MSALQERQSALISSNPRSHNRDLGHRMERKSGMTKAEKIQLLFFIQNGVKSSSGMGGMAEQWAALEKRLPAPGDHARIMCFLDELRNKGLIYAQEATAKGETDVLMGLELTERGESCLYRGLHRFWFLASIWKETKDFAATVAAKRLEP